MSEPPAHSTHQKRHLLQPNLQTFLLVLAVLIAILALYLTLRDNLTSDTKTMVDVSDGVTSDEAEAILARADDTAAFVGNLLSFLEATFAVITLGLIVGGWMLRAMILDQVEEMREIGERTERQIEERGQHLNQLEEKLAGDLMRILQQTQDDIAEVKKEASASFRVLSLQLLAEQQVRAHNIETAIATLMTAHEIDPDDHATNYLLGYLYTARKNELENAIVHLEHALAQEPDFIPGIAALGLALRRKGDSITDPARFEERDRYWAEAEAKLREALSKDKKLTDPYGQSYFGTLGGLYRRQKRYNAALDAYEQAHTVTPSASYPLINLAAIHKHEGNNDKAAGYFKQVLKQASLQLDDDPRDAWTRCDLAQALLVLGQPDQALQELQIVIDQQPERDVLETVYDGLKFLTEAPDPIPGLDELIELIQVALQARTQQATAQEGTPDQGPTS